MEDLIQLIHALSTTENKWVEHHYALRSSGDHAKRLKLYRLVRRRKVQTNAQGRKLIYGKEAHSAYSQLKKRVKYDVLEVLRYHQSVKEICSESERLRAECFTALEHGRILIQKGVHQEAALRVSRLIDPCTQAGLYHEALALMHFMQTHFLVTDETRLACREHMEEVTLKLQQEQQYEAWFHEENRLAGSGWSRPMHIVNEVPDNKVQLPSDKQKCYALLVQMMKHLRSGAYAAVKETGAAFSALLSTTKMHYNPHHPTRYHCFMSIAHLHSGEIDAAERHFQAAMALFEAGTLAPVKAFERLFKAMINCGMLDQAATLWRAVNARIHATQNPSLAARWRFFRSVLAYKKQDFKTSLKLLRANQDIIRQSFDWHLGCCVLEAINMIEKGDEESLFHRYESFKRLLERKGTDNGSAWYRRCLLIESILKSLLRHKFDFKKTLDEQREALDLLANHRDYAWAPFGQELIRFDDWLMGKAMVA